MAKKLRQLLKDSRDCPKEQKEKLFEKLRAQENAKIQCIFAVFAKNKRSTVLFTAALASKIRNISCADTNSAVTLIDKKMLAKIKKPVRSFKLKD